MRGRSLLVAALCALGAAAGAQEAGRRAPDADPALSVRDCNVWQANASYVAWDDPTRTYAEGRIRFVLLDTEEPAAAAVHLMVLYPLPDGPFLDCRVVSAEGGRGFGSMSLDAAQATYDPGTGLTVRFPTIVHAGGSGRAPIHGVVLVTVNQATGTIVADQMGLPWRDPAGPARPAPRPGAALADAGPSGGTR